MIKKVLLVGLILINQNVAGIDFNDLTVEDFKPINLQISVTDPETGLMWQDSRQVVQKDWYAAKRYCQNLIFDGHSDWRLPNIDELMSISDQKQYKPAAKKLFKNMVINSDYWSSSEMVNSSSKAWLVNFKEGYNFSFNKSYRSYIRCVR